MPASQSREQKLHDLVRALCATEQADFIAAADTAMEALVNGAVALKHLRMYPSFAAEAVQDAISHEVSVRQMRLAGHV